MIPAMTYFRAVGHYHRLYELNGRVRNGNVWNLIDIVTGKLQTRQRKPAALGLFGLGLIGLGLTARRRKNC